MTIACEQEFRLFPTLCGYRRQWLAQDQPDLLILDARRIVDVDFTGSEAPADIAEAAAFKLAIAAYPNLKANQRTDRSSTGNDGAGNHA